MQWLSRGDEDRSRAKQLHSYKTFTTNPGAFSTIRQFVYLLRYVFWMLSPMSVFFLLLVVFEGLLFHFDFWLLLLLSRLVAWLKLNWVVAVVLVAVVTSACFMLCIFVWMNLNCLMVPPCRMCCSSSLEVVVAAVVVFPYFCWHCCC